MESALLLALSVAVAILVLALNLKVQALTIRGQHNLGTRIYQVSGASLGFGVLFFVVGMLGQFKVFTWAIPTAWISVGSVLVISVAIPLFVQGAKLRKTGDDLPKFGNDLYITARVLTIIAVVLAIVVVIIPLIFWLISLFSRQPAS
jgi:hypothetical protein